MKSDGCPFEEETSAAVISGVWPESLRAHASDCPDCLDTVLCGRALNEIAVRPGSPAESPVSASVIWVRAQYAETRRRISRADAILLSGSLGTTFAGIASVTIWKWEILRQWFSALAQSTSPYFPLYALIATAAVILFLFEETFFPGR